jgi:hypothetical protein
LAKKGKQAAIAVMIDQCHMSDRHAYRLVEFSRDSSGYRNSTVRDRMLQDL